MKRGEALGALLFAYLLITAGVTWDFGAYGLIASGGVAGLIISFLNIEGGSDDGS